MEKQSVEKEMSSKSTVLQSQKKQSKSFQKQPIYEML